MLVVAQDHTDRDRWRKGQWKWIFRCLGAVPEQYVIKYSQSTQIEALDVKIGALDVKISVESLITM
jgi:hypothetical protein